MKVNQTWSVLLLSTLLSAGCVTQTERLPYHRYMPPEEESVWDELGRELGWSKPPFGQPQDPFYKRAARGIKNTVAGWFSDEEVPPGTPEWQKTYRQLQKEQQEAFRRLKERQDQEQGQQGLIQEQIQGLSNED